MTKPEEEIATVAHKNESDVSDERSVADVGVRQEAGERKREEGKRWREG